MTSYPSFCSVPGRMPHQKAVTAFRNAMKGKEIVTRLARLQKRQPAVLQEAGSCNSSLTKAATFTALT